MKKLTVGARKGGCGKTTSAVNLASQFGSEGMRVLLVDNDPQATATLFAGYKPEDVAQNASVIAAYLPESFDGEPPELLETPWPGVEMWGSNPDLAGVGNKINIENLPGGEVRLQRALDKVEGFDLVIIDGPPSLDKLSVNAYCAADSVVVPVGCDMASVGGLPRLFSNINQIREYQKPDLEILGIFGNMRRNTRHSVETMIGLRRELDDLVFKTEIPVAVSIQDAQAARLPFYEFDGPASRAYRKLAKEIRKRLGVKKPKMEDERIAA